MHSCILLIPVFQPRQLLETNNAPPLASQVILFWFSGYWLKWHLSKLVITEGTEQMSDTQAYDLFVKCVKPQTTATTEEMQW